MSPMAINSSPGTKNKQHDAPDHGSNHAPNHAPSHIEEVCRRHGLRMTRQRIGLAHLLWIGQNRHISAENLYKAADQAGLRLSMATVYNTLNQWASIGLLRRVALDGGAVYFDTNISNHHHFYNEAEGHLIDVPEHKVKLAAIPPAPKGTQISSVDVVIRLKSVKN